METMLFDTSRATTRISQHLRQAYDKTYDTGVLSDYGGIRKRTADTRDRVRA